ncbi:MAG: class B sortase [Lachnospiraceae bacterium]|nr:class B sortase [Lachnospiraceae bacterium]
MAQNEYSVEGRVFRTEADYKRALRDKEVIDRLRAESEGFTGAKLEQLRDDVRNGKYKFYTLLGQDFEDELIERIKRGSQTSVGSKGKTLKKSAKGGKNAAGSKSRNGKNGSEVVVSQEAVLEELKRQEKRRKRTIFACAVVAVVCLGYFAVYSFFLQRTEASYDELLALKEKPTVSATAFPEDEVVINYTNDEDWEVPEVLDEYKILLKKNKKLIGWVKIDDTYIDYPVMQTSDNEYYLDHNLNQEYDKNGSIFMDKDCDVIKPSTNLILYGHHMQSGKMFGDLDKYSNKSYYEKHKYIEFDTIYEKGVYEVMYVFRSRVYSEQDVVFKYYQFIDAMSEVEFNSNMKEMAAVSLYDTGVTASYGDRLLTLSTCDYQEKNGRFVVVAKKVAKKE